MCVHWLLREDQMLVGGSRVKRRVQSSGLRRAERASLNGSADGARNIRYTDTD